MKSLIRSKGVAKRWPMFQGGDSNNPQKTMAIHGTLILKILSNTVLYRTWLCKKTKKKLSSRYFILGDVLYKRGFDGVMLKCFTTEELQYIKSAEGFFDEWQVVSLLKSMAGNIQGISISGLRAVLPTVRDRSQFPSTGSYSSSGSTRSPTDGLPLPIRPRAIFYRRQ